NLPNATNPFLALPTAQLAQSNGCAVSVSNVLGATNSRTAIVSVTAARVSVGPQAQTALLGGRCVLSVAVQSLVPLVSYQWLMNGSAVPWATNATLELTNVTFADEG